MTTLREAADEFLSQHRIAVAGVSRDPKQPANLIYRRLRDSDHEVFAANPYAEQIEGDRCYQSVTDITGGVDGVVIVTPADRSESVVADCVAAGVPRVWLHRGIGPGSLSEAAVKQARDNGITVIPGGCPNMFGETSDAGHRCMRVILQAGHKIPSEI